ncbi:MAG: PDZ domain-containing protein [Epulopiscium sp.]|nr:PDZ domain-containing protein [Candidatus Epulonipiscium sp.]
MPPILEILTLTLQSIAMAVFNLPFIMVVFIIYTLYQRHQDLRKQIPLYRRRNIGNQMIDSILQGILMGIGGSFLFTIIGIPIRLTPYLLFLLPIAFLLALFNVRYLCFSYATAILGILGFLFQGQEILGYTLPDLQVDISGLIALVAIMHLMEATLIFFSGSQDFIPVIIKQKGKLAVGFSMQKYWPIPLSLLIVFAGSPTGEGILMPTWWPIMKDSLALDPKMIIYSLLPLTAALGYGDIAVSIPPERKARQSAIGLFIYSGLLLIIAVFSNQYMWLQLFGIFLMPFFHEWIVKIYRSKELNTDPLYPIPKKGVRILDLISEGPGEKMGMHSGDIICKVNGIDVIHFQQLQAILKQYYTFLWIELIRGETQEKVTLEYRAYPYGINDLGIIPLLENQKVTYHMESMKEIGILDIFKQQWKKKKQKKRDF